MAKNGRTLTAKRPVAVAIPDAELPEDFRCSCGRNLRYPQSENESNVICKCGKKYLNK